MSISTSFKVSVGLVQKSFRRSYAAPGDGVIPQAKQKYVSSSGNYPQGFLAGSAHVGVKVSNTKFDDLALVTSDTPCMAAAVFTKNKFQAAPVTVTRDMLRAKEGQGIHSIIVNSGCANAVTGKGGLEDARRMGVETDKCLPATAGRQSEPLSSIVMSTGVIGQRLPIAKIISGIPRAVSKLGSEHDHWMGAAKAICTTDTFPKLLTKSFTLPSHPGTTFSMAGMTKGAGMIHPNMATLLGIICTDARVSTKALQSALKIAVDRSFNSISIDGDTSTNDTVAILANGAAIHRSSWSRDAVPDDPQNGDYQAFSEALNALTASLAQLVVRDGEGATKFVTIRVAGAQSHDIGHKIASTIARSPLVKTALYGRDANWGRILCAIGYAEDVPDDAVVPEQVGVSFVTRKASDKSVILEELDLLVNGEPQNVDEAKAAEILAEEDLEILVRLQPKGTNTDVQDVIFWTCDFSHEYVTINGDYRT